MSVTKSYILREASNPNAADLRFVDVQAYRKFHDLWDDGQVVVVELVGADTLLRLPLTDDFAERYDVVRRVSQPRPTPDARSYVVTFVNGDYVTPGGRRPKHEVELWSNTVLENDWRVLDRLVDDAVEVWPTAEDDRWFAQHVTTFDGQRWTV